MQKLYDIRTYDFPNDEEPRRVRILLPRNYNHSEDRYPVLYFNDGQNVFFNEESYSGQSWGVIQLLYRNPQEYPFIVVAIDHAEENRLNELSPFDSDSPVPEDSEFGGGGDGYLDTIVQVVKPDIDNSFRTLPGREHTAMIGSSMGGFITAYAGSRYNNVFGRLGVFSLCMWFARDQFVDSLLYHPQDSDTRVYIQTGTDEANPTDYDLFDSFNMSQEYINDALLYDRLLIEKGLPLDNIDVNLNHGETHSEYFWGLHLDECLHFLFPEECGDYSEDDF